MRLTPANGRAEFMFAGRLHVVRSHQRLAVHGPATNRERTKSLTTDKSADGIALIDLASRRETRQLRVGSDPEEFALSRETRHVIVANENIATASIGANRKREISSCCILAGPEQSRAFVSADVRAHRMARSRRSRSRPEARSQSAMQTPTADS